RTSGMLFPAKEIKLSFKIGGIVEKILVDEGEEIKKDELLAQLDLSEINAQFVQAKSGYEKATRDFKRIQRLYSDSAVTLEQLQNAETALNVARSNQEIAQFNLKHSKIIAPARGKILRRFVESKELVGAGYPVFLFGSTESEWIVRVGVTDRDVVQLQIGDSASISFDAYPNTQFTGSVSEISSATDPRSATYEVELSFNPGNLKVASGFVASVEIFPTKKQQAYLLPIEALVEADGTNGTVFAVTKENSAREIQVTIQQFLNNQFVVSSSLEGVSAIITEGSAYLVDGAKIKRVE
ncbi:efflux RND transporter periplasmic adaptor subunit, partial [candidate division KSB1 bacterium]|nr:efflux RND transporter periplasmic adaptor subunit [candidate division KSB1 bacterium]